MANMNLIAWIVLGGFAGWLASLITGLGSRMGCLMNIIAGTAGAAVGGWLFKELGHRGLTGFDWWTLFVAFVGAVVILLGIRLIAIIIGRD